jgi:tRNA (guanine37-N1)-methyltransferase
MLGRAQENGLISIQSIDIRAYSPDKHHITDDYQFGGGPGMVMKPDPIFAAVEDTLSKFSNDNESAPTPVILLSPQGRTLNQAIVSELAKAPHIVIICGHYAGVDERVRTHISTDEISIGDYVLTGGELGALVIIDSVSRFVSGVVGSHENVLGDSITSGVLQHPLYTRPARFRSYDVPEILRSGNHADIQRWRREQSLKKTLELRADLLYSADLDEEDIKYLDTLGHTA